MFSTNKKILLLLFCLAIILVNVPFGAFKSVELGNNAWVNFGSSNQKIIATKITDLVSPGRYNLLIDCQASVQNSKNEGEILLNVVGNGYPVSGLKKTFEVNGEKTADYHQKFLIEIAPSSNEVYLALYNPDNCSIDINEINLTAKRSILRRIKDRADVNVSVALKNIKYLNKIDYKLSLLFMLKILLLILPGILIAIMCKFEKELSLTILLGIIIAPLYNILFASVCSLVNIPISLTQILIGILLSVIVFCIFGIKNIRYYSSVNLLRDMAIFIPVIGFIIVMLIGSNDSPVPAHLDDASNHISMATNIERMQTNNPRDIFTNWNGVVSRQSYYTIGLHTFIANISKLLKKPVGEVALLATFCLVALAPICLYLLMLSLKAKRLTAWCSAMALTMISVSLYSPFGWGGWTQVVSIAFLPFFLYLFVSITKRASVGKIIFLALALAIGFSIHASLLMNCFFLFGIYFIINLKNMLKIWKLWLMFFVTFILFFIICNSNFYLLFGQNGKAETTLFDSCRNFDSLKDMWVQYMRIIFITANPIKYLGVLGLGGMFLLIFTRKLWVFLIWTLIMFLLCIDAHNYLILNKFYLMTTPYAKGERLIFVLAIFLSVGIGYAITFPIIMLEYIRNFLIKIKKFNPKLKPVFSCLKYILVGGIILYVLNIALFSWEINAMHCRAFHKKYASLSANDLEVVKWGGENLPSNSVIATDGTVCRGNWIDAFTPLKGFVWLWENDESFLEKIKYLRRLPNIGQDVQAKQYFLEHGVDYVFASQHEVEEINKSFDYKKLMACPEHFIPLFISDDAAIFKIVYNKSDISVKNILADIDDIKVSGAADTEVLFDGNVSKYNGQRGFASLDWTNSVSNNFLIEWAEPQLINEIKIYLFNLDKRYYQYVLEVYNAENNEWIVVGDRRKLKCRGIQQVVFKPQKISKIRLTGTGSNGNSRFHVVELEAGLNDWNL